MSAQGFNPTFGGQIAKSRQQIKRQKGRLYKSTFDGLEDGEVYRDPMGYNTPGAVGENTVELQKARRQQFLNEPVFADGSSIAEKWDELHVEKNFTLKQTAEQIQKNLDTGDWTLPVDIISDVFVVNPERLPMADTMTRATTQDDVVTPTPLTDHPEFAFGLETTDDTEGSYEYKDATYTGDLSFDVLGMGAATRLEDKLILASSNVRTAESTQEEAFFRGGQQTLERQIIRGTDYNANGPDGFNDFISSGQGDTVTDLDPDSAAVEDYEEATRSIINEAEYQGANRDRLAVVTDFEWHENVREAVEDQVRYEPMADVFGISSVFEFDGVPVFKSHGIPRISDRGDGSTYNQAYTVNLEATYLSVLQEMAMKPLAKVAPQESTAFDMYWTLTSEENGAHIQAATVSPTA